MTQLRNQLQATLSGRYTIERELGGGGMSRVFVAEELRLKRKVVVKVLSPELAQGISVERFEREIQTVAALQQANIVPVHTAGDTNGLPYYTMPFVEGESLRARLARGPLAATEVIGILRDVTRALAYAHQRGVVHRDIKPDNILMSGGAAVVTDFGIAKAISAARTASAGATLTQIGTSIGTPAYMAPEQAAGEATVDQRADIYSLGAMAYELLAGQAVFAGRTPQRLLAAHMSEAPKPITEFRGDLPEPLALLVMQCLAKEAKDRPQSAADIARVLDTITSGSGMRAMPPVLLGGPRMFRKALMVYAGSFVTVAVLAKAAIVGIGLPDWVFPGALIVMALVLPVVLWTGYVQRVARRAMTMTPTYMPGGSPGTTAHGTIATMALQAAPRMSWYRTARGGMYALGAFVVIIAGFMAMREAGIGPFGSLLAAGKLSAREPIILTDFRTTNVDSALGGVVSDAVRAGLGGSSAFTLAPPAMITAALALMKQPPSARLDSGLARQIAMREGVKAIVDGDVIGMSGGYIVSLRLVRADSGTELASFRETGDGPRGLIDAADRLARALRGRAGESLRAVNATPPLFRVTTGSLDALRKYSEAARTNQLGNPDAVALAREAVAIDSTFASAWSLLGAVLSDYGGTRSAIDSAITQAYRFRERLPAAERDRVAALYYGWGPGRDRARAIATASALVAAGDSGTEAPTTPVLLGEQLRTRREFAAAESLNWVSARQNPRAVTPLGNIFELQIDQGKVKEAAATLARLREVALGYANSHLPELDYTEGDINAARYRADSLRHVGTAADRLFSTHWALSLALLEGRLHDVDMLARNVPPVPPDPIGAITLAALVRGPSSALSVRLDSALAKTPFRGLAGVDRPYFAAAIALAVTNNAAKAREMLGRYRAEITDTTLRRAQEADEHVALGYVALAEGKPQAALAEFRRGDVGYDGKPANECAPCLPLNLARAFEAAGQRDSAAFMFERYLATPFYLKLWDPQLDPSSRPAAHEHLGQLYEGLGNAPKAAEHYRQFIELWKNADAELQPRVAAAKRRLARLTPVERPR